MKANELSCKDLMVGDWVRIKMSQHNTKVTNIDANSVYTEAAFPIRYDEIEPIPLTAEILEKNGFVNVENTQTSTIMYSFRGPLFRIEVYDFNHITIDSYYTDSSCDIFISSIHELQHALRLCGIKKEIVLW